MPTPHHSAFESIRELHISALDTTLYEYRHKVTGARHLHLAAENSENVFLVAFKTMPEDSTGVAHILEHTVLCGSARYPVRDPFFLMLRRSLNTFMNAFTASDWTAYPFASQNKQDFDNLLGVYLDAVFFPHLHELDFAQEGIRIEAASKEPDAALVYKGVVYNEMKGAMSSPHTTLNERVNSYLYPTTTYHNNSGGDPAHIPDLTHQALKAFHQRHYHPGNAVFMTYGDESVISLQTRFEELALQHFDGPANAVLGRDEKRYVAPVRVEEAYAPESNEGPQTHHVLAWLLGPAADVKARFEAHLLSGILLENSASPLRAALEQTELGQSPSALMGLDDQNREMAFMCGLEGSEPEHAAAFEALVMDVLQQVVEHGVPQDQVEAVLHQFELSQREIGGDSYPYGLQLVLNGLNAVLQEADPVALWDIEPSLQTLRLAIQDPGYVPALVRRLLIDNAHRVRVTLRPDAELSARRDALEAAQLAAIKAKLTADDLQQLSQRAEALAERQAQENDLSCLPKVTLADVPAKLRSLEPTNVSTSVMPVTSFAQGTNGLFYQQLIIDLPALTTREAQLLPVYTSLFAELGAGQHDYLTMQQRQSAVSGGLRMSMSARTSLLDSNSAQAHLVLSGKALSRNEADFQALMADSFGGLRFDEDARIRELLAQLKARWESSVTGQGHQLAASAAARNYSALASFQQQQGGLFGIRFIRQLNQQVSDAAQLQSLQAELSALHQRIMSAPRQALLIAEADTLAQHTLDAHWSALPAVSDQFSGMNWQAASRQVINEAWLTQTQVQFCAKAYPAVASDHADAPALMALGGFLRNGFLHRAIREQGGAYGGGAGYDANACAFRFFSYRDPRLAETLQDFDASIDWLLSTKHKPDQLEEAMLGIFADMDKPRSPAGEARQAFHNALYGRTPAQCQQLRERLLAVSISDLQRVAEQYLLPATASTSVIAPSPKAEVVSALGLTVQTL
ncbi:MAG: insulinase family protein [Moraxellaceae bacterium]|nr:insulinase family protein [Moraxellaceae bacterium]